MRRRRPRRRRRSWTSCAAGRRRARARGGGGAERGRRRGGARRRRRGGRTAARFEAAVMLAMAVLTDELRRRRAGATRRARRWGRARRRLFRCRAAKAVGVQLAAEISSVEILLIHSQYNPHPALLSSLRADRHNPKQRSRAGRTRRCSAGATSSSSILVLLAAAVERVERLAQRLLLAALGLEHVRGEVGRCRRRRRWRR